MGKAIINYDAATTNELLDYVKEIKEGGGINLDAPKDGNLYGQQDGEWKQAQEKLVDGESIKTLNGVSMLGSGNIDVAPTIGGNGNWFINGEDTGKPSKGTDGKNGADGVSLGEIALVQETGTESGSENKVMSQKAVSTKFSELKNEVDIKLGYPSYTKYGSYRYYRFTVQLNVKVYPNGKNYSVFYAKKISSSPQGIEEIVGYGSSNYEGTIEPKDGFDYLGIWDSNLSEDSISVTCDGAVSNLRKDFSEVQNELNSINSTINNYDEKYEKSGSFRYYDLDYALYINVIPNGRYSIFYAKYKSSQSIEYIVENSTSNYEGIIEPKEGFKYLGMWDTNISVSVKKDTTINRLINDVSKLKNDLPESDIFMYPSQLKSEIIKQVCADMGIPIIDQNQKSGITVYNSKLFLTDGTHPNNTGKEKSATLIASEIKKIIDSSNINSPKMADMGDSITSNQVTNTADLVRQRLNAVYLQEDESDGSTGAGNVTTEFGNLACGWSTLTDYYVDGENKTTIRLLKSGNVNGQAEETAYNVLSNQILRLAQHTTPMGEQIVINAPDGTSFSVPTEIGVGKGYTDDKPDIIYIAASTNDYWSRDIIRRNDWNEVKLQKYNELKKDTIPSALRWAIITLQSLYPKAYIFVCTPLQKVEDMWKVE